MSAEDVQTGQIRVRCEGAIDLARYAVIVVGHYSNTYLAYQLYSIDGKAFGGWNAEGIALNYPTIIGNVTVSHLLAALGR